MDYIMASSAAHHSINGLMKAVLKLVHLFKSYYKNTIDLQCRFSTVSVNTVPAVANSSIKFMNLFLLCV